MLAAGCRYAVVESTSHGLSERTNRLGDVAFDVAVLTNVTHDHLEFHGTLERYRSDKANLFRALSRGVKKNGGRRFGVINLEDPHHAWFRTQTEAPVLTYGVEKPEADLWAAELAPDAGGTTLLLRTRLEAERVRLNLPGPFNVENLLAAVLAVTRLLGLPLAAVAPHVPALRPVRGRMEPVDLGQPFKVVVDYAHTPAAFRRVLPVFRRATPGTLTAVFGSAGERDLEKRPQLGAVAAEYCDRVVLADEDPRGEDGLAILRQVAAGCGALQEGRDLLLVPDRRQAIRRALAGRREGTPWSCWARGTRAASSTPAAPSSGTRPGRPAPPCGRWDSGDEPRAGADEPCPGADEPPRRGAGRRGLPARRLPARSLLAASLLLAALQRPWAAPAFPAPPPRLEAVLRLEMLGERLGGPAARRTASPPGGSPLTALAAGAEGVTLAFADRILSLDPFLRPDWRTERDLLLASAAPLPPGFTIGALALAPLGEVVLFDAESGQAAWLHPLTARCEGRPTGIVRPTQFGGLPSGEIALLQGSRVALFTRLAAAPGGLERRLVELPAGVYTALAARDGDTLWAFDWRKRRVIAVSPAGEVVGSIALRADPAALPFAQVLAPCSDGGVLLGGPGELWRFSPAGEPLWRLDRLPAAPSGAVQEAFPAAYALAVPPDGPAGLFYVADFSSGRVLRLREPAGGPAGEEAAPDAAAEAAEAAAAGADPGRADPRRGRAAALEDLSLRLEEQLLLPEAEAACAEALERVRELRREDPVDPDLPRLLEGLTARRQALRAILFEEPLLEARLPGRLELYRDAEPLVLVNRSAAALERLEVTVVFSGLPQLAAVRLSAPLLAPGAQLTVPLAARPEWGREARFAALREEAAGRVSVRVDLLQDGEARTVYHSRPVSLGIR